MNNSEKLRQTFASALSVDLDKVVDELAYNTIDEWDSTAHMILISELENDFDVMLETDEIIDLSSVAKAKEILQKYNVTF
ncbi:acyl carrier protein [Glaciecola sp. KUL10]|uniref:acyl carrier protein n=1 Tax=Glaciecola sp. (strain KUL10) TaxID=2161813 RepID=UPI000D78862A|nr:acyl carrier protein [Glaciecola sp. KUL10]GBL04611.1 acyl carrier protein [Glaciecola sp. KUL10]